MRNKSEKRREKGKGRRRKKEELDEVL